MLKTPFITAVAAITLDGKIAKHSGHFSDWTSPEDKDHLHAEMDASDVIIVGKVTYDLAREPLSKRNCIVLTRGVETSRTDSPLLTWLNTDTCNIVDFLYAHNYAHVCVLGGTQVYTYFLQKNLLDKISLTVEPIVFGQGLPLFEGDVDLKKFTLISTKKLNAAGTVVLEYVLAK